MGKDQNPTEYTVNLRENMETFIREFWEEFRNQENKQNKASDRRMRALLRQFQDRVYRPYRLESLGKDTVGLDSVLSEEE